MPHHGVQLLAPFCPSLADEIDDNLDGSLDSVHLQEWPEAVPADAELERALAVVREAVRLGSAARGSPGSRSAGQRHAAVVVASGHERAAIEPLADVALEELNVKELRYVSQTDELGSFEVGPNYLALGPR